MDKEAQELLNHLNNIRLSLEYQVLQLTNKVKELESKYEATKDDTSGKTESGS